MKLLNEAAPVKAVVEKDVKVKKKQSLMDKVACDKYKREKEIKKDMKEFDRKIENFADRMVFKDKLEADTKMREVAIKFLKLANVYEESDYIKNLKQQAKDKKLKRTVKQYVNKGA